MLAELFAASLAVHVTSVVPIGNTEPDSLSQVGPDVTPMLSVTVGSVYVTTVPAAFVVAFEISSYAANHGGVSSM